MKNNKKWEISLKKVFKEIDNMTDEEFKMQLNKYKDDSLYHALFYGEDPEGYLKIYEDYINENPDSILEADEQQLSRISKLIEEKGE